MENQNLESQQTAVENTKKYAYVLNQELMKGVLEYMVRRPYAEVFQLIDALRLIPAQEVNEPAPQEESEVKAS